MILCILLIRRLLVFVKIKVTKDLAWCVAAGTYPSEPTVAEIFCPTPIDCFTGTYKREQFPLLFKSLEAFKQFIHDWGG